MPAFTPQAGISPTPAGAPKPTALGTPATGMRGRFPTAIKPQAPAPNPVGAKPTTFTPATQQGVHAAAQQAMKQGGDTPANYDAARFSVLYGIGGGEFGPDVGEQGTKTASTRDRSTLSGDNAGDTGGTGLCDLFTRPLGLVPLRTKVAANGAMAAASLPPQPGPAGAPMPPPGMGPTPAGQAMPPGVSGPTDPGGNPMMGGAPMPGGPMGAPPMANGPMGPPPPPAPGTPGGNPKAAMPDLATDLASQGNAQKTTVGESAKGMNLSMPAHPADMPNGAQPRLPGASIKPQMGGGMQAKSAGSNSDIEGDWLTKLAIFGRMGRDLGRVGSGYKSIGVDKSQFVPQPRAALPAQQPLYKQIQSVMQQRAQPYGPWGRSPFTGWNKLSGDYTFNAEDCPKCGVSMEGDSYSGKCNSCQHKWGTKKAAHNGDLKGPIAVSASGESKGLSFADAGPIRHGKDAWHDMSKYMKGHSKRTSQPDPFQGKHAFDKQAILSQMLRRLVGGRPAVPGFRTGPAPTATIKGTPPVSAGTPTTHAVLTPGGTPRPLVPGFRVENPAAVAPKPATGGAVAAPSQQSSQIAIGGGSSSGTATGPYRPPTGSQPAPAVKQRVAIAREGMRPSKNNRFGQSVQDLNNWAFKGGPRTWTAAGLAGLGGIGAAGMQNKAAVDITQPQAPPPPPTMLPQTQMGVPDDAQSAAPIPLQPAPPPMPMAPPMMPPGMPPPDPTKTASAPAWLQTLGGGVRTNFPRQGHTPGDVSPPLAQGTGLGISPVSSSTGSVNSPLPADGRDKVAGAAWRSPEALQAIAGRMGVSAPTRLGMLSRVKGGLGLNRAMPGVVKKIDSMPRTSFLPKAPAPNADEAQLLYRGHRAADPNIGNAFYRDQGLVNGSPNINIAADYSKATIPGMGRVSQVTTYRPKPGQTYSHDFGLESGGPQGTLRQLRNANIAAHETNVAGLPSEGRYLVSSSRAGRAQPGANTGGIFVPPGKGNDAFINNIMAPAPGKGPIGMTPKTAAFMDLVKKIPAVQRITAGANARPVSLNPVVEEAKNLAQTNKARGWLGGYGDRAGVHKADHMAGAAIGAPAAIAADAAAGGHEDGLKGLGRRAAAGLTGAAAGAKGLNAVTNVGRRYVSNTAPLYNYSAASTPFSLKKLWNAGVMDRRQTPVGLQQVKSPDTGLMTPVNPHETEARYELLRRYLGIHKGSAKTDYFTRNQDGSFSYNKNVVRPGSTAHDELIGLKPNAHKAVAPKDMPIRKLDGNANSVAESPRYSTDAAENPYRGVFGSHDTRTIGGNGSHVDRQIGDTWNFAIDPHERAALGKHVGGLLNTPRKSWRDYLNSPIAEGDAIKGDSAKTIGGSLKSLLQRQGMESLLRKESPVIRQNIRTHHDGEGRVIGVEAKKYRGFKPHAPGEVKEAALKDGVGLVRNFFRAPSAVGRDAAKQAYRAERLKAVNAAHIEAEKAFQLGGAAPPMAAVDRKALLDKLRERALNGERLGMGKAETWDRMGAQRTARVTGQQAEDAHRRLQVGTGALGAGGLGLGTAWGMSGSPAQAANKPEMAAAPKPQPPEPPPAALPTPKPQPPAAAPKAQPQWMAKLHGVMNRLKPQQQSKMALDKVAGLPGEAAKGVMGWMGRNAPKAFNAAKPQIVPGAMGALGGAMTADSFGMDRTTGALAGAAAFSPAGRALGARYAGKGGNVPVNAIRGAVGGNFAGAAVDTTAGQFGYDTGGRFGRLGAYAGGAIGGLRGTGSALAANPATRAVGVPMASMGNKAMTGMSNFAQGSIDPILGGARRGANWLTGGRWGGPGQLLSNPTQVAGKFPSTMRRAGQVVGTAGLVGAAGSAGMGYLDDKFNQKANETFQAGLGAVDEYADQKFNQYTQAAPGAIARSAVNTITDPIFRSMGMNAAGMHPAQKAMMMGGAGLGAFGAATGNPFAMGAGALATGGGYMASRYNPLTQGYEGAAAPGQQGYEQQQRNELAHQQQLQQAQQPQPQG